MSYLKIRCCHLPARISFLTEDTGKLRQIIPNVSTVVSGKHSPRGRTFPVVDKSLRHLYRPRCLPCTLSVPAVSLQGFGSATTPYITDLRTALGRSGRNSQLANLYSEIADASDADYILGMLEREPGFINAVKRLRLEKQALPVLKKRVMEAADGNRSFNYENEWLRNAVDAMPPDEQEAFIGSYWTKSQRSRNRSNNDWELRERRSFWPVSAAFRPSVMQLRLPCGRIATTICSGFSRFPPVRRWRSLSSGSGTIGIISYSIRKKVSTKPLRPRQLRRRSESAAAPLQLTSAAIPAAANSP